MAEAEAEAGAAVELRGLPPDLPEELLLLYFENRRRSGGGPVSSWNRLGCGGILTFEEPADAERVLARAEHRLCGARLSLRPAPPRAPARLLLQGLPPDTSAPRLEQHMQALLCAAGHPGGPCRALASPRPDRALVQLPAPLSEAEVRVLGEQARNLRVDGAEVSLAWVPRARAVRVVDGPLPVDPLMLELYLQNERHSGGGPLEGLRRLPRRLGTVVSFRQWQAAERVLQRSHWLQGSELSLVPHYDVLEPEEPEEPAEGRGGPRAAEHALPEAGGAPRAAGTETEPEQLGGSLRTGPQAAPASLGPLGQEGLVSPGPAGMLEPGEPQSPETLGSPEQAGLGRPGPVGSAGLVGPEECSTQWPGPPEPAGLGPTGQLGPEEPVGDAMGSPKQEGMVELVLPMEPGAVRFLQLYHEDLLASLGDVALFPLEGMDVTGFRLCGARALCQAAEELLQSLLGGIGRHALSLKHPGSARFLQGAEGQRLLQGLEAQFQCVFEAERLTGATVDMDPEEVDPTEALQDLPDDGRAQRPPDSTGGDQENTTLEEVRELLATLEGLDGEDWLALEPGGEELEEQREEEASAGEEEEEPLPGAPSSRVPGRLEEEASLQLALQRSLEPHGQAAEREEAAALRRALALSLLEQPLSEAAELPALVQGADGLARLVVHVPFEQDVEELHRALETALGSHLQEETARHWGRAPPAELCARVGRRHGVSVAPCDNYTVLRGFGAQPARAARHLAALLAGPFPEETSETSDAAVPDQRLKGPLGTLEDLAESTEEFQEVVKAFYDTLDAARTRIHIVRVERVSHPLLKLQYGLHRERLAERCTQHPAERVLYHGTTAAAVVDICAHGFNRSFCGRNAALYGKGVYFARRASVSVLDRYSPPNADGHKAVFVARVLTGDYGPGSQGLLAPPLRACGRLRYDSAVDSLERPSIFVIFHDTQALPTHLITCSRTPQLSPPRPSPAT